MKKYIKPFANVNKNVALFLPVFRVLTKSLKLTEW